MNEKSRAVKSGVIERNCTKCCHNEVCQYKGAFENLVCRVLHEVQGDDRLLEMDIKCKYHMYKGGTTYKFDNNLENYPNGGTEK